MSRPSQIPWGALSLVCLAGWILVQAGKGVPQAQAAAASGWEYRTTSVEIGALAAKLTELGQDGWDVVSILNTDFQVENAPDGTTHLVVRRMEVTAKRPK